MMQRNRVARVAKKAQSRSPQDGIAELARDIVMYGTVPREPGFWDLLAEDLLIRVLPAGPDAALAKIRSIRASPENHAEELAGFPSAPNIIYGVIAEAESTLAAHLRRVETWIPKGAVAELYRASRGHYRSPRE
jgi:hypothetical protein